MFGLISRPRGHEASLLHNTRYTFSAGIEEVVSNLSELRQFSFDGESLRFPVAPPPPIEFA